MFWRTLFYIPLDQHYKILGTVRHQSIWKVRAIECLVLLAIGPELVTLLVCDNRAIEGAQCCGLINKQFANSFSTSRSFLLTSAISANLIVFERISILSDKYSNYIFQIAIMINSCGFRTHFMLSVMFGFCFKFNNFCKNPFIILAFVLHKWNFQFNFMKFIIQYLQCTAYWLKISENWSPGVF